MTDEQARIIAYLRDANGARTGKEIARHVAQSEARTFDLLRELEDIGQVVGGESGFYRVPGTLRKRRGV